jgi:hypothetical protein
MENNKSTSLILKERLESNFSFDLTGYEQYLDTDSAFFKYLQERLAERIKFFIRTDLDKLLQALYRIDINDSESDQAFDLGEINKISSKLAELIIRRQLQKLNYSKSFKES